MEESHIRSLVKGVTWRVAGTMSTVAISFIVTGQLTVAVSIGFLEFVSKLLIYYFHERAWILVKWGRKQD